MGVLLVAMGTCVHEWTWQRMLPEAMPMRASARLHWWYLSLNAWGVGIWLIVCRHRVQPVAVVMDARRMVAAVRREVEARGASLLIVQLPT
jgi:hypothetical protein